MAVDSSARSLSWLDDALCAQTDPELFNPVAGQPTRPAQKVCEACDVRQQCLDYAMSVPGLRGIYGGLTEIDRRKIRMAS